MDNNTGDVVELTEGEKELFELIGNCSNRIHQDAYVIGGFVRDRLLGRENQKDIDFVTVGDGPKLAREVGAHLPSHPEVRIFKRFGTAMIKADGWELEFVGARKESYAFESRKPVVKPGTLEDDQNRRDFTINALAISLQAANFGALIDPFGGINDLNQGLIQTPLDPEETFSDDPLRMMRAIRFAAQLNFQIDPVTFSGIQKQSHRIQIVSAERISVELEKIIASNHASKGIRLLSKAGLLEHFLPEFEQLKGVDTRKGISHKDNFDHTLEVLDNVCKVSDNLWLRWAALLHDIGKPRTKRFNPKAGWTFHGHDAVGAKMVPKIFKRLRLSLDQKMKFVQKLVRLHLRPISLTKEHISDAAVRRLLYEAGDEIDELLILCEADITSKNPRRVERYLKNYEKLRAKIEEVEEKDHLRNWQPPISGDLIMETFDISPSKEVGIIKTAIREAILDGEIPNDFEAAYQFMMEKGKALGLQPLK